MNEFLTETDVAQILCCKISDVNILADTKQLPAVKFGTNYVFPQQALVSHLNYLATKNLK